MNMILVLILTFCLNGYTQEQDQGMESHEFSVLDSEEIKIKDKSFLYMELGLRGMNRGYECLNCGLNDTTKFDIKKFMTTSLAPSLIAGASVIYTDPSKDKLRHFSAGYVAGNLTMGTLQILLPNTQKNKNLYSFLGGVGASVVIGAGKEYWDSLGHGQVEMMDALATIAGGITGSLTVNLYDINKLKKKKKFRPLALQ
jgi:hypothetical protein